jgi:hypothetical protein
MTVVSNSSLKGVIFEGANPVQTCIRSLNALLLKMTYIIFSFRIATLSWCKQCGDTTKKPLISGGVYKNPFGRVHVAKLDL